MIENKKEKKKKKEEEEEQLGELFYSFLCRDLLVWNLTFVNTVVLPSQGETNARLTIH